MFAPIGLGSRDSGRGPRTSYRIGSGGFEGTQPPEPMKASVNTHLRPIGAICGRRSGGELSR
jgi:hypothetical protein